MKRIIAFTLLLSMLLIVISSCSNNTPDPAPETTINPTVQMLEDTIQTGDLFTNAAGTMRVRLNKTDNEESTDCALYQIMGTSSSFIVPEEFESVGGAKFKITIIGDSATCVLYNTNKNVVTSVTLPSSTLLISQCSFELCSDLEEIKINEGLIAVGTLAFFGCSKLKTVNLPSTLISIGNGAFQGAAIESLVIPKSVTSIGYRAFSACKNLKTVTLPRAFEDQLDYIFGTSKSNITFTFSD